MGLTVPRADGQPVATRPLPGVRGPTDVPAGVFAGPKPVPVEGAVKELSSVIEREQAHADNTMVLDADNQLARLETDIRNATAQRKGKDAFGAPDDAMAAWEKGVSAIEATLGNDRQQEYFRRRVGMRADSLYGAVTSHAINEGEQFAQETAKTALESRFNDAVQNYDNLPRIAQAMQESDAILQQRGHALGWDEATTAAEIAGQRSRMHAGVIARYLANDQDLAAKAYYEKAKPQLLGEQATHIEQAIELGSAQGESQRQADAILGKTTTLTEAVALARAITDPKVRDLTEQRVRQDYTEKAAARAEQRAQLVDIATNIIEQTKDFTKVPPAVVAVLPLQDRKSLRDYAQNLQKGEPPITNWKTYYGLMTQASTDRSKFLGTNLIEHRNELADAEFKQLTELQKSLRGGDQTAEDRIEAARQIDATIKRGLESVNINPNPKPGTTDATQVEQFYREFKTAKSRLESSTKKPATEGEVQGLIDDLLVRGAKQHWWSSTPFGFELSISDVPDADRLAIRQALQARGRAATDDEILRIYRKGLKDSNARP